MRDKDVVREVELDKDRMTIGRKPHNDIVIPHAAVSGEHAVLTQIADDVFVEDLSSSNGTYVNGQRVTKYMLEDHDVLVVAKFRIEFVSGPRVHRNGADLANVPELLGTIEVKTGPNAGKRLALDKPISTLGRPGIQVVAITRQGNAYYFTHVDGQRAPLLNGRMVGKDAQRLADGDAIELAGADMVFSLAPA